MLRTLTGEWIRLDPIMRDLSKNQPWQELLAASLPQGILVTVSFITKSGLDQQKAAATSAKPPGRAKPPCLLAHDYLLLLDGADGTVTSAQLSIKLSRERNAYEKLGQRLKTGELRRTLVKQGYGRGIVA